MEAAARRAQRGWILYDLANTIFALGVVGLYLPAWLQSEGLADSSLALTEALAGIAVIVLAPMVGATTDRTGRRLPLLAVTTGIAIGATAGLASFAPLVTLALLGVGLVGLNVGAALYDALLADVAPPSQRGRISGLGVGVGYVGSFVGLAIGRLVFDVLEAGFALTFQMLAAGFLLFAIPIFLWVREGQAADRSKQSRPRSIGGAVASWRAAAKTTGMVRFLVGRFLYTDAINTLIGGFLAIFVLTELDMAEADVNNLLAVAIATAIAGGIVGGRLVTRVGARRTLELALATWIVAMILGVIAARSEVPALVWAIGPLGGAALGATWAADRVLMLDLSPPARLGEFYGLYATVGRFATIVGPLVWALVVDALGWGRPAALLTLAGFVFAGLAVIRSLPAAAGPVTGSALNTGHAGTV
ncbi:MAG TPA: MFS transporter [Acidimicrobiia bacterium]